MAATSPLAQGTGTSLPAAFFVASFFVAPPPPMLFFAIRALARARAAAEDAGKSGSVIRAAPASESCAFSAARGSREISASSPALAPTPNR
jgi:hypothetical protein